MADETKQEVVEKREFEVQKEFIVDLKGKLYPTWPGVLDAAINAGLVSLKTTVVQIPSPENGNLAVVMARAEFMDGRVFEDVGDCSPESTTPKIAPAALRMASTRAKGRVLRDSINCGDTLLEELPDEAPAPRPAWTPKQQPSQGYTPKPPAPAMTDAPKCSKCPRSLTAGVLATSTRIYGKPLCMDCQQVESKAKVAANKEAQGD